ncbi:MAG TPA: preprotein translocase subunit SecA [Kofleriaceae bacterium]|jgi:preprotein translocase subunit SecA
MSFFQKVFGNRNQRELRKMQPVVNRINDLEAAMKKLSEAELKAKTGELKQKVDNGASLDEILPEAFAVVREAGVRRLGMRHYDVQLIGGMVLHSGKIAEMRTGEGKTLVATLPTYLNALNGKGVHVVTVNDYLAKRDAEWMGQLHGYLGLTTGVIVHGLEDHERQANYNCDITYGQNNEFGFDYLRDNMKLRPDLMVQRGLEYAVVDEVDSILIDEARTPLIISGSGEESADLYEKIDRLIPRLKREVDYTVDEKAHSAMLTDDGVEKLERLLEVKNLYEASNIQLVHHVNQALRAHTLYKRNVNYLIDAEQKVVIISEDTGRAMPGRRWSDGLHQAIEAKEGVKVEEENQTLATVTFQNYFRLYKKLSGMTGTADTEAPELNEIYKLDVVVIPTNKPMIRKDMPDLVYKNEAGKFRAVVADVADCHERGQPVLVGTVSVEKSEVVANLLKAHGLPFNVLNAKQHQREASIVAQAGRKGAITIATNMAGRGTDILLGGNPEALAKDALTEEKSKVSEQADEAQPVAEGGEPYRGSSEPAIDEEARIVELTAKYKTQCEAERKEVLEAGGLKIIGTERHESRRVDNQLRGRAGRQGDPGGSRFYLSLQDDLLRIFGLDKMSGLMERLGLEEDVPIESPMVTRSIEGAQKKVEGRNFDQRKNVLEYDDVMNQQRKTIYSLRRQILEGKYHRAPTEEEEKAHIVPDPVTESGDWTIDTVAPTLKEPVGDIVDQVLKFEKLRPELLASGNRVDDRPAWRILRHEFWVQFSSLLPLDEKKLAWERDKLVTWCTDEIAKLMIQQRERLYDLADERMAAIIDTVLTPEKTEDEWDWDELEDALTEQFTIVPELQPGTPDEVATTVWPMIEIKLREREDDLGRRHLMYYQRQMLLRQIDSQWMDHLKSMDALREGIGLQGYGQKDPKKEYKRIGFDMFSDMLGRIRSSALGELMKLEVEKKSAPLPQIEEAKRNIQEHGVADKNDDDVDAEVAAKQRGTAGAVAAAAANAAARRAGQAQPAGRAAQQPGSVESRVEPVRRDRPKVGRNDPCPCGSGKKYKKCHGKDEEAAAGE